MTIKLSGWVSLMIDDEEITIDGTEFRDEGGDPIPEGDGEYSDNFIFVYDDREKDIRLVVYAREFDGTIKTDGVRSHGAGTEVDDCLSYQVFQPPDD